MDWHRDGVSLREDGYSTELIADEAINIIKNKDDDRPLFLYVAFNAPHTPIEAPEEDVANFLYIEDELDRNYAANISKLDIEIGRIINSIKDLGILEETIIIFLSDNGPVFDINPIVRTIAPGLTKSKGSTAGLRGSKTSALDGGIRVPAAIWWKGVLEKSKSDQFIFIQDLLPTLLTATGVGYDEDLLIDGIDRWSNLVTNKITPPDNAFVGNKIIFDERALFNNDWKLYYKKPVMFDVEGSFKLFNIVNDPYEKEDLSTTEINIFNEMKDTLMNIEELNSIGTIDPVHAYLHGDTEGGNVIGSPWLDRDYELNQPVSKTAGFFIMIWVLIQSFKYQLIGLILFFATCRFAYKRYNTR
jgi:arylsulfatase A-like enzyme